MDPGAEGVQSTNKFRVTASGEVTVWFTQSREGREKDNFLIFFFAALRDKKCARRMRGASPCRPNATKTDCSGHDKEAEIPCPVYLR
jgi:hypothetical protein